MALGLEVGTSYEELAWCPQTSACSVRPPHRIRDAAPSLFSPSTSPLCTHSLRHPLLLTGEHFRNTTSLHKQSRGSPKALGTTWAVLEHGFPPHSCFSRGLGRELGPFPAVNPPAAATPRWVSRRPLTAAAAGKAARAARRPHGVSRRWYRELGQSPGVPDGHAGRALANAPPSVTGHRATPASPHSTPTAAPEGRPSRPSSQTRRPRLPRRSGSGKVTR